jgi:hypothetical protein
VEIAHAAGVYVMVDAAGEMYPLDNMSKYVVEDGADVQCIATKYIGGSQSTGAAIGSEDFVRKMFLQTARARPGRLSALCVSHRDSSLHGVCVWARTALYGPFRRVSARAVRRLRAG